MHKAESIKYLGDSVHESGKVKLNMMERRNKANAAFAEIRAMLEDVPLGIYRTEIGLNLRQALFINGVLFNSKVWHGVQISDIDVFYNLAEHMQKHPLSFYILKLDPFLWHI